MNIPITTNYPHNEDSIAASGLVPSFEQWLASIEAIDMDESSVIERQAARIDKLEKLIIEARPALMGYQAYLYVQKSKEARQPIVDLLERMRNI